MKKQKYSICLLPQNADVYIEASKQIERKTDYVLSETSLPHVTLVQFEAETLESAEMIWSAVLSHSQVVCADEVISDDSWLFGKYLLNFTGIAVKEGRQGFYVEVLVHKTPKIVSAHNICCDLLESTGNRILNLNRENFSPHLTLATISYEKTVCLPTRLEIVNDLSVLCFGLMDEEFQLIKVLSSL